MMAKKARLGWSTGPSEWWALEFSETLGVGGSMLFQDSSDNTLWFAASKSSPTEIYISNLNEEGEILSDKAFIGGTITDFDSINEYSSFIHAVGTTYPSDPRAVVFKISRGDYSISWQKEPYISSTTDLRASLNYNGNTTDSSGNVVLAYQREVDNALMLTKADSSGAHQWTYDFDDTNGNANGSAVSGNGGGSIAAAIRSIGTAYFEAAYIDCTTPTITWQRRLTLTGATFSVMTCEADSTGSVYVLAMDTGATDNELYLSKWNSAGTLQWKRKIYDTGIDVSIIRGRKHIYIDGSDDVFIAVTVALPDRVVVVAKVNTGSGVFDWEKSIKNPSAGFSAGMISGSSSALYVLLTSSLLFRISKEASATANDSGIAHGYEVYSGSPLGNTSATSVTEGAGSIPFASYTVTWQNATDTISGSDITVTADKELL